VINLTIARPAVEANGANGKLIDQSAQSLGAKLVLLGERLWDRHHDAVALMKPQTLSSRSGP